MARAFPAASWQESEWTGDVGRHFSKRQEAFRLGERLRLAGSLGRLARDIFNAIRLGETSKRARETRALPENPIFLERTPIRSKTAEILLAIITLAQTLPAADESFWRSDFEEAMAEAKSSEKPVLLYFTGSDWCHWCRKLDNELFAASPARELLAKRVVPIALNFPQKGKAPPGQVRKNRIQQQKWKVKTFPTVILFDPVSRRELWRHSYLSVTPDNYLKAIETALGALAEPL